MNISITATPGNPFNTIANEKILGGKPSKGAKRVTKR